MTDSEKLIELSTKLDILIDDFQEFKKGHRRKLDIINKDSTDEVRRQIGLVNEVRWHSFVGAIVMTGLLSFGGYIYIKIERIEQVQVREIAQDVYYVKNREVIVEIIESYKKEKRYELARNRK